jgi:hypothetical protein
MRIITRDQVGVYVEVDQRKGRILLTWDEIGALQEERSRHFGQGKARPVARAQARGLVKR